MFSRYNMFIISVYFVSMLTFVSTIHKKQQRLMTLLILACFSVFPSWIWIATCLCLQMWCQWFLFKLDLSVFLWFIAIIHTQKLFSSPCWLEKCIPNKREPTCRESWHRRFAGLLVMVWPGLLQSLSTNKECRNLSVALLPLWNI